MKHVVAAVMLLGLFAVAGCGPKSVATIPTETPPAQPAAPSYQAWADRLAVAGGDGRMEVTWVRVGKGAISGYNIYISREPNTPDLLAHAHNDSPFPGDTDPDDGVEHYTAEGLDNGTKYYVSVRVVYPNGMLSRRSNEVLAVCGPRGTIDLTLRYQGEHDGWSFENNRYSRADATDNDLYFFSREGEDFLASPDRLNGFLNANKFIVLPYKGSLRDVSDQLMQAKVTAADDQVRITEGDWVLVSKTNGRHALMHVDRISGADKDRRASLTFVYCLLVGETIF